MNKIEEGEGGGSPVPGMQGRKKKIMPRNSQV